MKYLKIALFFVVMTLILADLVSAQYTVVPYQSLKSRVNRYDDDMKELKQIRKPLRLAYDDLQTACANLEPLEVLERKANILKTAWLKTKIQQDIIGMLLVDIFTLDSYDLVAAGWSKDQIQESKKWNKVIGNARDQFRTIEKNGGPDEFQVSNLIFKATNKWDY